VLPLTARAVSDLDPGIGPAVRLLAALPGVSTTHSCEGRQHAGDRHAALAYVRIAGRWPHGLRDHLARTLASVGRVEDDAVYARHARDNALFGRRLAAAVAAHAAGRAVAPRVHRRFPLVRLKGRVWAALARGGRGLACCARCGEAVATADGARAHEAPPCLTIAMPPPWNAGVGDLFGRFLAGRPGVVDDDLLRVEGAVRLRARLERGAFGAGRLTAWRTYLDAYLDALVRDGLWDAVEAARRQARGPVRSLEYAPGDRAGVFTWQAVSSPPRSALRRGG
jgi:hypothetical protein